MIDEGVPQRSHSLLLGPLLNEGFFVSLRAREKSISIINFSPSPQGMGKNKVTIAFFRGLVLFLQINVFYCKFFA